MLKTIKTGGFSKHEENLLGRALLCISSPTVTDVWSLGHMMKTQNPNLLIEN